MRYLFFTNTPAHVHLYRAAVSKLAERGHDVRVLARDYGCTMALLDWYGLPYRAYGACGTNRLSLARRLPGHYVRFVRETLRFDPDHVFGIGPFAAHAGAVSRTPTVLILDSEPSLDHTLSRPFVDAILTPAAFRKDLGSKHYVFEGFKECAYLHPAVYTPQADVREELGLPADAEYAVLRFNAWGGHHDVGNAGFSEEEKRTLIERLSREVDVFVSDEGGDMELDSLPARPFDLHPALLHDALAEATLLVADTQTIVTEAALLGTPAIRSNSFVGPSDMGNFIDLERHGLIFNLVEFEDVLDTAEMLLEADDVAEQWREKRDAFMRDKVNLTELILEVADRPDELDRIESLAKR